MSHQPGKHLLIDFYGVKKNFTVSELEGILRQSAEAIEARILNVCLHEFGLNSGITGVAILAESHISIHTWPETGYIAIDIFVCGKCIPDKAVEPLKQFFKPEYWKIKEIIRGD